MPGVSTVRSVNLGASRPNPAKSGGAAGTVTTGIAKRPVDHPVPVRAPGPKGTGGSGLVGDHVGDRRHHGGDDQAVYAYAREDLDAWEGELGRALADGCFGENLTTAGVDVTGAVLGERWHVGDGGPVLEVSCPRVPCRTFSLHLGEERWVPRFTAARVPGAYLRVLEPGTVRAGARVEVRDVPAHGVTVGTAFAAITTSPDLLPLLLDVPTWPLDERADVERRVGASWR